AVGSAAAPRFADIDGDGDFDAFIGNGGGNTIFFRNTGSATAPAFGGSSNNAFGLAMVVQTAVPAFGDIDGDGDLDAFIGDGYGNTTFFRNSATVFANAFGGTSTNPFGLADVGMRARPVLADINADGDLDSFSGEFNGSIIFRANTGSATSPAFGASS